MEALQYADWGRAEYLAIAKRLLLGQLVHGPDRERLSQALRPHYPHSYVCLLNSGSSALRLLLLALRGQAPDRRQVLVPAYICPSVPETVRCCDLEPVLVPVGSDLNVCPHQFAAYVNEHTLALIAAHIYGCPCDIAAIEQTCREKSIFLIDDAAQAIGIHVDGRPLGSFGDAGLVSFAQSKAIIAGVSGAGGILISSNDKLESALREASAALPQAQHRLGYLLHFLGEYQWQAVTGKTAYYVSRALQRMGRSLPKPGTTQLGNLDAALAQVQLARLGTLLHEKRRLAALWFQAIEGGPLAMPQYAPQRFLARIVLRLPEHCQARAVAKRLALSGIQTRLAYPKWLDSPHTPAFIDQLLEVPARTGMKEAQIATLYRHLLAALEG